MEKKIVRIADCPGFSPLNLDLTDTFDKFDCQTASEAKEKYEQEEHVKAFIDLEYDKWRKNYNIKQMPFQNALDFIQVLLKATIKTK